MTLYAWAESLVLGDTLAHKLQRPGALRSAPQPAWRAPPPSPGRPSALILARGGDAALPSPEALSDAAPRVHALHAFANHELLAIELFALALLRFPDAPETWRRDVVRTIAEEQKHLRDYLQRIDALGGTFGQHPVSGYFWRCLSDASTVDAFVAGMSLTLEQANLDFALSWRTAFAQAGDAETADLLQGVYEDEVRHVARGVAWFERDGAPLRFQAWAQLLPTPLSPTRARGGPGAWITFDADGRTRAGIPAAFMEQLRLHASTRGRAPTLWDFDLHVETRRLGQARAAICDDLAGLAMFFASEGDLVRAPEPSDAFLLGWVGRGLPPCGFLERDSEPPSKLHRHVRWAPVGPTDAGDKTKLVALREALVAAGLSSAPAIGVVISTIRDLEAACVAQAAAAPFGNVVLKAPFGTAGRGQRRVQSSAITPADVRWAARTLDHCGALLVEPLLHRLADLTVLLDTSRRRPLLGVRVAQVSPQGRFLGHSLGPRLDALGPELQREVRVRRGGGSSRFDELRATATWVATWLREQGHRGPAGIDAFLHLQADGQVALQAVCEINARRTMGHVALQLERWVEPASAAAWRIITRAEARHLGGIEAYCRSVLNRHPPDGEARLRGGVVALTDPARAQDAVAMLSLADTPQAAWAQLEVPRPYSRP